jgi:beta-glucosidase
VAETLFGANEFGKLPFTLYKGAFASEVSKRDMHMEPSNGSPGRTYRYYTGSIDNHTSWWYGFGLSYTNFTLHAAPNTTGVVQLSTDEVVRAPTFSQAGLVHDGVQSDGPNVVAALIATVTVTNVGAVSGSEVVQAYASGGPSLANRWLWAFERVFLEPGESRAVHFHASTHAFAVTERWGERAVRAGRFDIMVTRGHGEDSLGRVCH